MGQPKRQRKNFQGPKKPYDKDRISEERKVLREYGLRRKTELWKAASLLRNFRRRVRELLANPDEKKQKDLFNRLNRLGIRVEKLDDVLDLKLDKILARRLQTIVHKKGLAKTANQARQLIVHRHVLVDQRKVGFPSYLVLAEEEDKISLDDKIKNKIIQQGGA
jgi:small subunit ribosomal protein S4